MCQPILGWESSGLAKSEESITNKAVLNRVYFFNVIYNSPTCFSQKVLYKNMISEKFHYTFLQLDSRNQKSTQISDPHGDGLLCPPDYTFYSRSCISTYKFWLVQVGWFVLWLISVYLETRESNLRSSIYDQRKIPFKYTFLPLDSRNQESADSWFLESNGEKVLLQVLYLSLLSWCGCSQTDPHLLSFHRKQKRVWKKKREWPYCK
jgi:hypothetical protein